MKKAPNKDVTPPNTPPEQLPELVTDKIIMAKLGIRRSMLGALMHHPDCPIPYIKLGHNLRFNQSAVATWLKDWQAYQSAKENNGRIRQIKTAR